MECFHFDLEELRVTLEKYQATEKFARMKVKQTWMDQFTHDDENWSLTISGRFGCQELDAYSRLICGSGSIFFSRVSRKDVDYEDAKALHDVCYTGSWHGERIYANGFSNTWVEMKGKELVMQGKRWRLAEEKPLEEIYFNIIPENAEYPVLRVPVVPNKPFLLTGPDGEDWEIFMPHPVDQAKLWIVKNVFAVHELRRKLYLKDPKSDDMYVCSVAVDRHKLLAEWQLFGEQYKKETVVHWSHLQWSEFLGWILHQKPEGEEKLRSPSFQKAFDLRIPHLSEKEKISHRIGAREP